jgi:hypothetical protein
MIDAARLNARQRAAIATEAPFVLDRLVKDRVAEDVAEAEQLFAELKKFLVLCDALPENNFGMISARIDAAWHAFILFTSEYSEFGDRYFGRYLHHAPVAGHLESSGDATAFDEFRDRYEQFFGVPLPEIWYDEVSVGPNRRVINDGVGSLSLTSDGRTVELVDDGGSTLLSVDALAFAALDFILHTPDFYVRELPGDLTDEEKVGLARSLMRVGALRVAA